MPHAVQPRRATSADRGRVREVHVRDPAIPLQLQVDLTAKELTETSAEDRLRMQMQLTLTFRSQPDVVNVELRANQDLVRVEDNGSVLPPVLDRTVPSRQIAISRSNPALQRKRRRPR